MFKPQKSSQEVNKRNRLPALNKAPDLHQIRMLLVEASRMRGCLCELPIRRAMPPHFVLCCQYDSNAKDAVWTLYEGEEEAPSKVAWSYPSENLEMVFDMVAMSLLEAGGTTVSPTLPAELLKSDQPAAANPAPAAAPQAPQPAPAAAQPQPAPQQPQPMPVPQQMPYGAPGYPVPGQAYPPGFGPPQAPYPPGFQPPNYQGQPFPPQQPWAQPGQAGPGWPPGQPVPPGYPPGYPPAQPGQPYPYPAQNPYGQSSAPAPKPEPAPAGMSGFIDLIDKQQGKLMIGHLFVEAGLIPEPCLDAALKLQEMVRNGVLNDEAAIEALRKASEKGGQLDESLLAMAMQKVGSAPAVQQVVSVDVLNDPREMARRVIALVQAAGIISEQDYKTAATVRAKHGGDIGSILIAAGKMEKATLEAARQCQPLLIKGRISQDQAVNVLRHCQKTKATWEDALKELSIKP